MAFRVVMMVGVSGSGKSTLVKKLAQEYGAIVVSADNFHVGPDGYKFDPARAAMAHSDCFNAFLYALRDQQSVIVDNTNISLWERQNYADAADMAGAILDYHVFVCDTVEKIKLCARRNVHGVPIGVIADMACRFDLVPGSTVPVGSVKYYEIAD